MCDCKKDSEVKKDLNNLKSKLKNLEERLLNILEKASSKAKDQDVDLTFKD
tara:strand:- start:1275 stop:1427 length:153 start_codon:yes stop_codon:yes gene_type:complete